MSSIDGLRYDNDSVSFHEDDDSNVSPTDDDDSNNLESGVGGDGNNNREGKDQPVRRSTRATNQTNKPLNHRTGTKTAMGAMANA